MKLLKMLAVASALAIPVSAFYVATSEIVAEAKGKKPKAGKKMVKKYKTCGTFKYRKGGKCLDARDKGKK